LLNEWNFGEFDSTPATPELKQIGKMTESSNWAPTESLLVALLRELGTPGVAAFSIELRIPGSSPYPFFQAARNEANGFIIEFSPEKDLVSQAAPRSSDVLKATQWHMPSESNPNWHKQLGKAISVDLVARHLIVIARAAFGVSGGTWMRLDAERHSRILPARHGLMVDPLDPFLFRLPTNS
jgi:hypothetical protein